MVLCAKEMMLLFFSMVLVGSESNNTHTDETHGIKQQGGEEEEEENGIKEIAQEEKKCSSLDKSKQLEYKWTFWYENKSKKERRTLNKSDYLNQVRRAGTFDNMAAFWNCWNDVQDLCRNSNGDLCNYLLFKQGIKPVWEDPKNAKGGKCSFLLPKTTSDAAMKNWVSLMLTVLIGEFDVEINGAVLSSRAWGNMFSIWIKNSDKRAIDKIVDKVHELFGDIEVKYQKHQASIRKKYTKTQKSPNDSGSESVSDEDKPKLQRQQRQDHHYSNYDAPKRRSVVSDRTKGVLHNLITEVMEAPAIPPVQPDMHVHEIHGTSAAPHITVTLPGCAAGTAGGHISATMDTAHTRPDSRDKKRKRGGREPAVESHNELSTLQMTMIGALVLVGAIATSALSWIYL